MSPLPLLSPAQSKFGICMQRAEGNAMLWTVGFAIHSSDKHKTRPKVVWVLDRVNVCKIGREGLSLRPRAWTAAARGASRLRDNPSPTR